MTRENVAVILHEIRNHVPANTVDMRLQDGTAPPELNLISVLINEIIRYKYSMLIDERIYDILEKEPEDTDGEGAINVIKLRLLEEVHAEPIIGAALRTYINAKNEANQDPIEKAVGNIYRLIMAVLHIMERGGIEFVDKEDDVVQLFLKELTDVSNKWLHPEEEGTFRIGNDEVDQAVFILSWITYQMQANGIEYYATIDGVLTSILRVIYHSDNLRDTLIHLGHIVHSLNEETTVRFKAIRKLR